VGSAISCVHPHFFQSELSHKKCTAFGKRCRLPVESPGESITFIPPFVALVGTALWDTSIWVSLFGEEHEFDGHDTVIGKFPHWRRFHVQNRSEDIVRAKQLIQRACENYKWR
jgi:hypothetical protein